MITRLITASFGLIALIGDLIVMFSVLAAGFRVKQCAVAAEGNFFVALEDINGKKEKLLEKKGLL